MRLGRRCCTRACTFLVGLLAVSIGTGAGARPAAARPAARTPADSIQGALRGLAEARATVERLDGEGKALAMTAAHERKLARDRDDDRRAEQRRRTARAAAMYRHSGNFSPLGSTVGEMLDEDRVNRLYEAGDRRSRANIADLRRTAVYLRASAVAHDEQRTAVEAALLEAVEVRDTLADKLANSRGGLVAVRPPAPISAAGSVVAQRADRAAAALRATSGEQWGADPAWLEARHALTTELVARGGGRGSTVTLELEWDETPKQALVAVLAALRQVGKRYVYATAGPSTFDCSGLTKRAYAEAGLGIPHFSATQLRIGASIPRDQLRAGDLLAYGPGGADHVAMYVGGGIAVEARSSMSGVVVNPARTGGTYAGATRLVP
jgi:cell wall-associated NlpC family hydrolase